MSAHKVVKLWRFFSERLFQPPSCSRSRRTCKRSVITSIYVFLPKTRHGARWFSHPGFTGGTSEFQRFFALFGKSFHWKFLWLICVSLCEFSSVSTRPVTHCRSLDLHANKSSLCCLTRTDSHLLFGSPWNLWIPSLHRIIWPPTWTQAISQAGVCCSRDDCRTSWHPEHTERCPTGQDSRFISCIHVWTLLSLSRPSHPDQWVTQHLFLLRPRPFPVKNPWFQPQSLIPGI